MLITLESNEKLMKYNDRVIVSKKKNRIQNLLRAESFKSELAKISELRIQKNAVLIIFLCFSSDFDETW